MLRTAGIAVLIALAGCSQAAPPAQATEPDPLPPLPPPLSDDPANLVGTAAGNDTTGQIPPSPWAQECARQWRSGGYRFESPPVVDGRACTFLATDVGTMFWHVVDFDGVARHGVPAAPIPRQDGFFDWAVFLQDTYQEAGGQLALFRNGSSTPDVTWPRIMAESRRAPSAVALADSIHVLLYGWDYALQAPTGQGALGQGTLHHAWWEPGGLPQVETVPSGSVMNDHTWRTAGATAFAIGSLGGPLTTTVYYTTGGAFQSLPPVAGTLFDVVYADGALHACVGSAGVYLHAQMPWGEAGPGVPVWTYEPIAASVFAPIAFTCDIADSDGLVVVVDTPALDGNGPNPLGGSIAYRRGALAWEGQPIGFTYHSGDDLATAGTHPLHVGMTGSGTSNMDPRCGLEVRAPVPAWQVVFCNHAGDWAHAIDHERPLIAASALLNPPFSAWGTHEPGPTMTSVALVLPPLADGL